MALADNQMPSKQDMLDMAAEVAEIGNGDWGFDIADGTKSTITDIQLTATAAAADANVIAGIDMVYV